MTLAKLTVQRIETAKSPAKLTDKHGLYLRMSPRGAKSWIQRLNIQGLRTDNAIGHYPSMGLVEARVAASDRWKIAMADGKVLVAEITPGQVIAVLEPI